MIFLGKVNTILGQINNMGMPGLLVELIEPLETLNG